MDRSKFPVTLTELYNRLVSLGFETTSEQSGGMGGYDLVMTGRLPGKSKEIPVYVNFNADRGQWFLRIRFDPMSAWRSTLSWHSYLDNAPMEEKDIGWRARYLQNRLGDMVAAIESDPNVDATLGDLAQRLIGRRRGIE